MRCAAASPSARPWLTGLPTSRASSCAGGAPTDLSSGASLAGQVSSPSCVAISTPPPGPTLNTHARLLTSARPPASAWSRRAAAARTDRRSCKLRLAQAFWLSSAAEALACTSALLSHWTLPILSCVAGLVTCSAAACWVGWVSTLCEARPGSAASQSGTHLDGVAAQAADVLCPAPHAPSAHCPAPRS
jgi:hypothetical protein